MCTKMQSEQASQLLGASMLYEGRRYAVLDGKAFCADQHGTDVWHGWPVGWIEVDEPLRRRLISSGQVRKRQIDRYWDGHE